jgi:hypothetical protein
MIPEREERGRRRMAMIIGAHSIVYSRNPEADRAFFRDVLELAGVDVGGGWLIFGLPPAEVAFHPSEENDIHELYLMVDDVEAFRASLAARKVACSPLETMGWGMLTHVTLPGGGKLGVYQPRHARPGASSRKKARARAAAKRKTGTRRKAKATRKAPRKKR